MKRIIIDYKKLNNEMLKLFDEKYPDGYSDDDIISFKNLKEETIKAVELRDTDTIYLIKISTKLDKAVEENIQNNDIIDEAIPEDDFE